MQMITKWKVKARTSKLLKVRQSKSQPVLILHLIGWEGRVSFLHQSQSKVKQNQRNLRLFSTLNWKSL